MELFTEKIYTYDTFDEMLEDLGELPTTKTGLRGRAGDRHKIEYLNVPAAYDTETTSFYYNGEKCATTYAFMFGICGRVCLVRKWDEFLDMMARIVARYHLSIYKRIVVYVHNLSFEFAFMGRRFSWHGVFAGDPLSPIYAVTEDGIEFRDSMILSGGLTLDNVGKNLTRHKIAKAVGDLDYNKIRNWKTPLTAAETRYCVNDVFVLLAYIAEKLDQHGDIWKIPLTNTGYVRQYCREACMKTPGYFRLMEKLQIRSVAELDKLMNAYGGGFVHAAAWHVGRLFLHICSWDFTSSYPATILSKMFPMGRGFEVNAKTASRLAYYLKKYCCLFDLTLYGLRRRDNIPDSYISRCKCLTCDGAVWNDNGRLIEAEKITITVTEIDFRCISKCYTWDKMEWGTLTCYRKDYLPKPIIESVLHFYEGKTTLKGVDDMVEQYMLLKGMLNAIYGAMVQKLNTEENMFVDGEWIKSGVSKEEAIQNYNESHTRFLFLPWGIWVTAHARENLWSGIIAAGDDYIYSDTDSVKIRLHENDCGKWEIPEKFADYVERYNAAVLNACRKCLEHYGIDDIENKLSPLDKKGIRHPIGVWDYEGEYDAFKCLGAKRYMVKKPGAWKRFDDEGNVVEKYDYNITVSGVNKYAAVPWIVREFADPFEAFADGLEIPPEHCGKMIHSYSTEHVKGVLTDYTGVTADFEEFGFVHLEKTHYNLKIEKNYEEFIDFLQNGEERELKVIMG